MNIIGVDHVQFAVRDVGASARYLARHGYELSFREADFNTQARSYFRGVKKDMAYLRRGASRVEVITGTDHAGDSRYLPVFDGLASPSHLPALDMAAFQAFWHEDLASACASRGGESPILDGVILRVSRPEHSCHFFQRLGFGLIARDDDWYTLAFPRNVLSMPLTISLARKRYDHEAEARVDDLGCSSIALITRNLSADRALLERERFAVSEVTPFFINQKNLTICFAAGPSGELVELVEMEGA
jgi:catechol 2,3-dioxygenase-like lactoylglutathione lyase family enzyme